ncbi:MAG: alpha/beta hydrolase [Phyllobacteriaceae bacterium]|nr:alpha/beta hydrolase [Phyllobacteriaceae bacterium]
MVLCAPFLGLARQGAAQPLTTFWAGGLARLLSLAGLGRIYFGGGPRKPIAFEANKVTRSRERFARNMAFFNRHPHLGLGGPTARWVSECIRAMNALNRRADSKDFRIPVLVLIAGADQIVPREAIDLSVRLLPAAHALVIDKAQHELLQETDLARAATLAAILSFIPGTGPAALRTAPAEAAA